MEDGRNNLPWHLGAHRVNELCIICQKETPTTLQRVISATSLSFAIEKRQNHVAKRLEKDGVLDILQHKSVMWHGECRRWYTLHKSCDLASKKRTDGILAETQNNDKQDDVCVAAPEYLTRLLSASFVKGHSHRSRGLALQCLKVVDSY